MGGSILIGIRRKDGTEYVAERWTNGVPCWLGDPGFWDGDAVVDAYIDAGKEGNFGGPCKVIHPSEYGVVLIDFPNKRVISRNGYTSVGKHNCAAIAPSDAQHLLTMIDQGWVTRFECWPRDHRPDESFIRDLSPEETTDFTDFLKKKAREPIQFPEWVAFDTPGPGMITVHFAVPGWSVDEGRDEVTDWNKVRAFLKDNGWKTKAWTVARVKKDREG